MRHLLAIPILLCSSCLATSGDLRDIADRVEQWEAGAITDAELSEAINGKAGEIEARVTEAIRNGQRIPSDPIELALWVAGLLGATGYGTYRATNKARDSKRVARGERV